MKIAVSSSGNTLDDMVDPRFGRCAYFVIVETDDMSYEAFDNESVSLGGGAGIQAAQFVANKGVQGVVTGNCGPNAVQTLSASHIKIYVGQSGTVREVIERFKNGEIESTLTANVTSHHGMGGGAGMGRGLGRGMGKGMRFSGMGSSGTSTPGSPSEEDNLTALKSKAAEMRKEIDQIESRIESLKNK
ncbi:MAG: NifB/NifX family molybdenum-iron cluster-binding protein [Deltaproteobacteria bacterium]|nr:NifB/NifX family molybdenum-iron cluster-binding protein [Deltaproteobacteria bacterium]